MTQIYSKYDTLPKLQKLTLPLFLPKRRTEEKVRAQHQVRHNVTYMSDEKIIDAVNQFVVFNHPLQYSFTYPATFNSIGNEIWEDLIVHRMYGGLDWTCNIHASFPNGWLPEKVVGKSFEEVHKPIPGIKLDRSYDIVKTCTKYGPFQRFVWTPIHEPLLAARYSETSKQFDPTNPQLFIRVETQITVPFPELEFFLFILRQELIEEKDIKFTELFKSLSGMTAEQKEYKGVSESLIKYVNDKAWDEIF